MNEIIIEEIVKNTLQEIITTIEINDVMDKMNKKKRISFTDKNEEILITDRKYLIENDLCIDLWYNLNDIVEMQNNATKELQLFINTNPGISMKNAMKILWGGYS